MNVYGFITTSVFVVTPSQDRLPAKAEDRHLAMRRLAIPHRTPTWYFKTTERLFHWNPKYPETEETGALKVWIVFAILPVSAHANCKNFCNQNQRSKTFSRQSTKLHPTYCNDKRTTDDRSLRHFNGIKNVDWITNE